jgi:hypothetical protein
MRGPRSSQFGNRPSRAGMVAPQSRARLHSVFRFSVAARQQTQQVCMIPCLRSVWRLYGSFCGGATCESSRLIS